MCPRSQLGLGKSINFGVWCLRCLLQSLWSGRAHFVVRVPVVRPEVRRAPVTHPGFTSSSTARLERSPLDVAHGWSPPPRLSYSGERLVGASCVTRDRPTNLHSVFLCHSSVFFCCVFLSNDGPTPASVLASCSSFPFLFGSLETTKAQLAQCAPVPQPSLYTVKTWNPETGSVVTRRQQQTVRGLSFICTMG